MSARPSAADLNAALLDAVTRTMTWLNTVLDELGWCPALPPWPQIVLTAPADIYLVQAHALDVQYRLADATCPCHRGWRGQIAGEVIRRWREVVDHAISFAVLSPAGRPEDLHAYDSRYRTVETTFHRYIGVLRDG